MRILAIDFGDVRTGLAVSDLSGTLTGDAWVITQRDMEKLADEILLEIQKRTVGEIVLGLPKNMDGSFGFRAEKTKEFETILSGKTSVPIVLWDERRTSFSADQILIGVGKKGQKKKALQDAVAASLILEGYLARR